jgi:hypothetical protein
MIMENDISFRCKFPLWSVKIPLLAMNACRPAAPGFAAFAADVDQVRGVLLKIYASRLSDIKEQGSLLRCKSRSRRY